MNACHDLPEDVTRRLHGCDDEGRDDVPFIEKPEDVAVAAIFAALPAPLDIAFAIGAMTGMRMGEVLALKWVNVDLDAREIRVANRSRDR